MVNKSGNNSWPIDLRQRFYRVSTLSDRESIRQEIAEHVKAYRANNGRIQRIPVGVSGAEPIKITSRNRGRL